MAGEKTGVDVLISVVDETDEEQVIGGQRGATLNREVNTIDATHKQVAGWGYNIAGQGSWSIDTDGVLLEDDASLTLLEDAFENKEAVTVQWTNPSGQSYRGEAIITSYPVEAPMDDVMTYSMSFQGQGKYEKVEDSGGGDTP